MTTLAEAVAQARANAAEMAQVLAELTIVSHGRTMRVDGPVTGSKDRSPILRVDEEPYPHEHYRARWNAERTANGRAAVLAEARSHLQTLRKTPDPPEAFVEPYTFPWKRQIAKDPVPIAEVARKYGVTRETVRRYRADFGDPRAA